MNNSLLNVLLKAADSESARTLLKELAGVDVAAIQKAQAQKQALMSEQVGSAPPAPPVPTPQMAPPKTPSMTDRIITDQSRSSTVLPARSSDERESNPIYADEIGTTSHIFSLEKDAVIDGIIWSEVLGKPKSRRRQ